MSTIGSFDSDGKDSTNIVIIVDAIVRGLTFLNTFITFSQQPRTSLLFLIYFTVFTQSQVWKMYDFCFTYPFALLLGAGGLMGYVSKGSTASLYGGVGSALILFLLGYISLRYYHQGKLCKTATFLSLLVSMALTGVMYLRYSMTGKLFPAGITMLLCCCMCVFYVWSLGFGPVPKIKSAK